MAAAEPGPTLDLTPSETLREALGQLDDLSARRMWAQQATRIAAFNLRREHLGATWTPEAHDPEKMAGECASCALLMAAAQYGV